MKKQVLVSVDRAETRVALLEAGGEPAPARASASRKAGASSKAATARKRGSGGGSQAGYRIAELYIERRGGRSIVGNIYKGKVDNVLPGLEAAFVDIGLDKNGFLHVDEPVMSRRRDAVGAPAAGGGSPICSSPGRRSSFRSSRTR